MLIWYANLPEETAWYYARQQSGWWIAIATLLIVGHFMVPFAALMSRHAKRRKAWLAHVAVWVIALHWVDIYYLVGPQAHHLHTGEAHDNECQSPPDRPDLVRRAGWSVRLHRVLPVATSFIDARARSAFE